MSEKPEKRPESAPPAGSKRDDSSAKAAAGAAGAGASGGGKSGGAGAAGAAGMLTKTPVLLGGAMLIEAIVLFAGFKFLGGGHPQLAAGAELTTEEKVETKSEASESAEKGEKSPAKPIDRKKAVEVD